MKIDIKIVSTDSAASAALPAEPPFRQQDEATLESGLLTQAEKDCTFEFQRRQVTNAPVSDRFAGEHILVADGRITDVQRARALLRQALSRRRPGEQLIDAGAVNRGQVERGLLLQKGLLSYALTLSLGLASLVTAETSAEAAQKNSSIQVSIMVVANAKIQIGYQAMQLQITAADIARGYVEAPGASRFSVSTNSRTGYVMDFHPVTTLFDSVDIAGLGVEFQLGADGGSVVLRGPLSPELTRELSFRFRLRPDVQPGIYHWPLQLSVRPM